MLSVPTTNIPNIMRMGFGHLKGRFEFRTARDFGMRSRVKGRTSVKNYGTLEVGERVQFEGTIVPISIFVAPEAKLVIGDRCYFNYGCSISSMDHVEIGSDCFFGTYVSITDNAFHELDPARRLERPPSEPVIIKNNVWIANRVVILPGVTIGEGAAVGAGSIVTKDIPPRTLAVGAPARPIRDL